MTFSKCVVLAWTIWISLNAASVKGENKTNNQNDTVDYQIGSNFHESKMLRDAFVKEFNSIMSSKNDRIQSLKNEILRVDKLIDPKENYSESSSVEDDISIPASQTTKKTEKKFSQTWELKDFVKRRLRNVFEKELNDIIKEKSCQIYLLEELLAEKRNRLALQKRLQKKTENRTVPRITYGVGEPSGWPAWDN